MFRQTDSNKNDNDIRCHRFTGLPKEVIPHHYKLKIKTDVDKDKFEGIVNIDCRVEKETNKIIINACDLKIRDVTFLNDNNKQLKPKRIECDDRTETVFLHFDNETLNKGKGCLEIKFEGEIDEKIKGLYRKKFQMEDREHCWLATELDRSKARCLFPCWDEPEFKSTFELTLEIPTDMKAISNTRKVDEKSSGDFKLVKFDKTPKICTHLVSFVVGKFDRLERNSDDIRVRINTPIGRKDWADSTMDLTLKLLDICKKHFNVVKFPLDKLDIVVMPNFHRGGTGNLGMIKIHEDCFYINKDKSSCRKKQDVALLLANKICRQWCENVVSIKWWTDKWLTDGLANFMKYMIVDEMRPDWRVWEQFCHREMDKAMRCDMMDNTHPLEDKLYWMWAGEHFNKHWMDNCRKEITSSKGACIIRMACHYAGKKNFQKALQRFVNDNKFDCVTGNDLWTALERECGKPIRSIMDSWTKKRGFPIVHSERRIDNDGNCRIKLRQENILHKRDNKNKNFGKHEDDDDKNKSMFNRWVIPLTICIEQSKLDNYPWMNEEDKKKRIIEVLMHKEEMEVTIPAEIARDCKDCININTLHMGYFVTRHDDDCLKKCLECIEKRTMNPIDRLGIMMDLFNLVKVGVFKTNDFLDIMKRCLKNEDNDAVWKCMTKILKEIRNICINHDYDNKRDDLKKNLDKFCQKLLKDKFREIGDWENARDKKDKDCDMLRETLLDALIVFEDKDLNKKAMEVFCLWCDKKVTLPRDTLRAVFMAAAKTNDETVLRNFIKIYKNYEFEEGREFVIRALGFFDDKKIVDKIFEFVMSDQVKLEDCLDILNSLARIDPMCRDLVWELFKNKCDKFTDKYDDEFLARKLIEKIIKRLLDEKKAKNMADFFEKKMEDLEKKRDEKDERRDRNRDDKCRKWDEVDRKRNIRNKMKILEHAIEYVCLKSDWMKRDCDTLKRYLANN